MVYDIIIVVTIIIYTVHWYMVYAIIIIFNILMPMMLTNSWEHMTHGILHPRHSLLLRGQKVILPNLKI